MRAYLLLGVLSLLLAGCRSTGIASSNTIIGLHSGASGLGGLPVQPAEACVWIVGRSGITGGLSLVLAHGGTTVQDCVALMQRETPRSSSPP